MKRKYTFFYSLCFLIFGFTLSSIYRPYIYNNSINDYGLADIGNNIVFIPGVYFVILAIRKKPFYGRYYDIIFHAVFLTIIEIMSKYIRGIGTFDFKDIFALFIGALLTFFIVKSHDKKEFNALK